MSSTLWLSRNPLTFIRNFKTRASTRVQRWARKRQGADLANTTITSRRVYILPTGVGLLFAMMAFAMLLGSMNYNNNLSFVLTFLLAGIGFVAMHQCQRNLVGINISFAGVDPVFAGQTAQFRIALGNTSKNARFSIRLYAGDNESDVADLRPGESTVLLLPVSTNKRGMIELPRFGIRTLFPFELFRAWGWLHMDLRGIVYPELYDDPPEAPPTAVATGHRQHDARGEEDFAGLRKYNLGDSPRNVAWKAFARSGQLLSKQFSGADTSSLWFDFADVPSSDLETRLSILTSWIVSADRTYEDYGLRLPHIEFPPGHGEHHRRQCLEALALFDLPMSRS